MTAPGRIALYLDPSTHHLLGDRLFEAGGNPHLGEGTFVPFAAIRRHFESRGVPVHTGDRLRGPEPGVRNVYVSMGLLSRWRELVARDDVSLSAFFTSEPPVVEPSLFRALPAIARAFRRVFSFAEGRWLEPYTGEPVRCERFFWAQPFDSVDPEIWGRADRRFLVLMNANKLPRLYASELYTRRLEAIEFFHRFGEIDVWGPGWNRMPMRVGRTWVPATARRAWRVVWEAKQRLKPNPFFAAAAEAWRGMTPSKRRTLGEYAFCLCFENASLHGWITEKLFDCLHSGTIPVYLGAPDVLDWVPAGCFVDLRRFRDLAELRAFLKQLGPRETAAYREAGRAYLESSRFDPFRTRTFVDLFRRIVREDTGVEV